MRSLKEHISEGLLQGMDSTLDFGDKTMKKAEKEFKQMKKYFKGDLIINDWTTWRTSMGSTIYQATIEATSICELLGIDNANYITIHCVNVPYTTQKDFTVGFYFHKDVNNKYRGEYYPIDLNNTNDITYIIKSLKSKFKTFNDFIEYTRSIL